MAEVVKLSVPVEFKDTSQSYKGLIAQLESELKKIKPGTAIYDSIANQIKNAKKLMGKVDLDLDLGITKHSDISRIGKDFSQLRGILERVGSSFKNIDVKDLNINEANFGDLAKQLNTAQQALANLQSEMKKAKGKSVSELLAGDQKALNLFDAKDITKGGLNVFDSLKDKIEQTTQELNQAAAEADNLNKKLQKLESKQKKVGKPNEVGATAELFYGITGKSDSRVGDMRTRLYEQIASSFRTDGSWRANANRQATEAILAEFGLDPKILEAETKNRLNIIQEAINSVTGKTFDAVRSKYSKTARDNVAATELSLQIEQTQSDINKQNALQTGLGEKGQLGQLQKQFEALRKSLINAGVIGTDGALSSYDTAINALQAEIEEIQAQLRLKGPQAAVPMGVPSINGITEDYEAQLEAKQFTDNLKQSIKHWMSAQQVVNIIKDGIRQAVQDIRGLDSAMTNIAVVTDMSVGDLWGKIDEYMSIAQQYGVSTQGVYEVSQLYYQQGLGTAEVMAATTETLKMARIAGMDYADAADAMTVAIRSFKMEMTDAAHVTDVYSKVAAVTASDSEELAIAMSKTASSAESVGSSFENTTAMLAVMIETTRESAQNLGSALKSIISRYGEMKVGATVDAEGEALDYNKVDTALKSIGISIKDAQGQFRDFDDVIFELSEKWDSLDKNTQRYIATIIAGNRQQSRFIALVDNWERLDEVAGAAEDSEDAGLLQYAKTLDSLETKISNIKTSFQDFYMSVLNGPVIGAALEFINKLIKGLNKLGNWQAILNIASLITSIKNIGTLVTNKLAPSITSWVQSYKTALQEFVSVSAQKGYEAGKLAAQNYQAGFNSQPYAAPQFGADNKGASFQRGGASFLSFKAGKSIYRIANVASLAGSALGTYLSGNGHEKWGAVTSMLGNIGSGAATGAAFGGIPGAIIGAFIGLASSIPALADAYDRNTVAANNLAKLQEDTEQKNIERAQTKEDFNNLKTLLDSYEKTKETRYDSDENYQAWIDVNNQLYEAYPELLSYIDAEGNAIIEVTKATQLLNASMMKAAEASKAYYDAKIEEVNQDYNSTKGHLGYVNWLEGHALAQDKESSLLFLASLFGDESYDYANWASKNVETMPATFSLKGWGYAVEDVVNHFGKDEIINALSQANLQGDFKNNFLGRFLAEELQFFTKTSSGKWTMSDQLQKYLESSALLNELAEWEQGSALSNLQILSRRTEKDDSFEQISGYTALLNAYIKEIPSYKDTDIAKLDLTSFENIIEGISNFYAKLNDSQKNVLNSLYDNLEEYSLQDTKNALDYLELETKDPKMYKAYEAEWYKKNYTDLAYYAQALDQEVEGLTDYSTWLEDNNLEDSTEAQKDYVDAVKKKLTSQGKDSLVNFIFNNIDSTIESYISAFNELEALETGDSKIMNSIARARKTFLESIQNGQIAGLKNVLATDPEAYTEFYSILFTDFGTNQWGENLKSFAEKYNFEWTNIDFETLIFENFATQVQTFQDSIDSSVENWSSLIDKQSKGFSWDDSQNLLKQIQSVSPNEEIKWGDYFTQTSEGLIVLKNFDTTFAKLYDAKIQQANELRDEADEANTALADLKKDPEDTLTVTKDSELAAIESILEDLGITSEELRKTLAEQIKAGDIETYGDLTKAIQNYFDALGQSINYLEAQKLIINKSAAELAALASLTESANLSDVDKANQTLMQTGLTGISRNDMAIIKAGFGLDQTDYTYDKTTDTYSIDSKILNKSGLDPQVKASLQDELTNNTLELIKLAQKRASGTITDLDKENAGKLQVEGTAATNLRSVIQSETATVADIWAAIVATVIESDLPWPEVEGIVEEAYSKQLQEMRAESRGLDTTIPKELLSAIEAVEEAEGLYTESTIKQLFLMAQYLTGKEFEISDYFSISKDDPDKYVLNPGALLGEMFLNFGTGIGKIFNTNENKRAFNEAIKKEKTAKTFGESFAQIYTDLGEATLEDIGSLYDQVYGEDKFAESGMWKIYQDALVDNDTGILSILLEQLKSDAIKQGADGNKIKDQIADLQQKILESVVSNFEQALGGTLSHEGARSLSKQLGGLDLTSYITQTADGLQLSEMGAITAGTRISELYGATSEVAQQLVDAYAGTDGILGSWGAIYDAMKESTDALKEQEGILKSMQGIYATMAENADFNFMESSPLEDYTGGLDSFVSNAGSAIDVLKEISTTGKTSYTSFRQLFEYLRNADGTITLDGATHELNKFYEAMMKTLDFSTGQIDFEAFAASFSMTAEGMSKSLGESLEATANEQADYWEGVAEMLEGYEKISTAMEGKELNLGLNIGSDVSSVEDLQDQFNVIEQGLKDKAKLSDDFNIGLYSYFENWLQSSKKISVADLFDTEKGYDKVAITQEFNKVFASAWQKAQETFSQDDWLNFVMGDTSKFTNLMVPSGAMDEVAKEAGAIRDNIYASLGVDVSGVGTITYNIEINSETAEKAIDKFARDYGYLFNKTTSDNVNNSEQGAVDPTTEYTQLTQQLAAVTKENTRLQQQIKELNEKIVAATNEKTSLEKEIENLQSSLNIAQEKNATLESELAEIKTQSASMDQLDAERKKAEQEGREAQGRIVELQAQIELLTAENSAYAAEVDALTSQLENTNTQIRQLTSEVSFWKESAAEWQEDYNKLQATTVETGETSSTESTTPVAFEPYIDLSLYEDTAKEAESVIEDTEPTMSVDADMAAVLAAVEGAIALISEKSATFNVYGKYAGMIGGGGNSIIMPKAESDDSSLVTGFGKIYGNVSGLALAEGNAFNRLNAGAHLANKTLIGELGPELAVYNGMYHLLGKNGAEFVDLPNDAIVFNHRQTEGIIRGQMGIRGKAMADGNVEGPAYAGGLSGAAQAARDIANMWRGIAANTALKDLLGGGGGGGGGGNELKAVTAELQEWYNLTRQIAYLEQEINNLVAERENITDGSDYLKNLRETQKLLEQQKATQALLLDYQTQQLKRQADFINQHSIWGKYLTIDESGLLQYIDGNEINGGKGALEILQSFNEMSGQEQQAYLKKVGYSFTDQDGKALKGSELAQKFIDQLQEQIDQYDALYDTVHETEETIEGINTSIEEINDKIKQNQMDLEEAIYDIIVDAWEAEIEQMQEQADLIKEANDAYVKGLQDALNMEKELYSENQSIEERESLQRQLSLLRRSGGSASEIASLEEQLDSALKDEYFRNQEEMISNIEEANENQNELLEQQIKLQEDALEYQKENGVIWTKVYEVMARSENEILDFMQGKYPDFFSQSLLQQEEMLTDWAMKIGIYTADQQYKNHEAFARKSIWDSGKVWESNTMAGLKAQFDNLSDEEKENLKSLYASTYANEMTHGSGDDAISRGKADQEIEKYLNEKRAKEEAANKTPTSNANPEKQESTKYWRTTFNGQSIAFSGKDNKGAAESKIEQLRKEYIKNNSGGYTESKPPKLEDFNGDQQKYINTKTRYDGIVRAANTYASQAKKNLKYYSQGGLVDYTGTAVVHGSPSKPEAFLNAAQTAQISEALRITNGKESLLESLRSTADKLKTLIHNISTIDKSTNQDITIAPGAVVIQVEQLADSYDIDEVSRDVMNRMVTIANKATNRGVSRR